MADQGRRLDLALATALSLVTVLSRLPYRARMLYDWDAVQFALALREFDIAKHQPHPPGYILYVGLGRLVNAWVGDPAATYVLLAVLFSGLTTFVVYQLARAIYDRPTALAAASLLAVSPLFWFYGTVGLSYVGEALGASVVAYFAFRALQGSETDSWLAALYLGLAGGLRPSMLVLLFPLWLGSTVIGVRRVRTVTIGLALLALATLTWLVPLVWLMGGLQRYLAPTIDLVLFALKPTAIGSGSLEALFAMQRHLVESTLVALGPLALAVLLLPWFIRRTGWGQREWFLLAWAAGPVLFYALVHFGQAGYALTFLPALVILLSRVLITALGGSELARWPRARAVVAATAVVVVILVNGSFFVSARPLPRSFDPSRPAWMRTAEDEAVDWIFSRTVAALREREAIVRTYVSAIRSSWSPAETVVITEMGNPRSYGWLRHATYYLEEYPVYGLWVGSSEPDALLPPGGGAMWLLPGAEIELPPGTKRLVWFVDYWSPTSERPPGLEEIELPYGRYLYVFPVKREPVTYAGYTFKSKGASTAPSETRIAPAKPAFEHR
jgi:hypothetical protein